MNNILLELKKDNSLLNIGSRIFFFLLFISAYQEWIMDKTSEQFMGFITVTLFIVGLVLIAFAFIRAEKNRKILVDNNIEFKNKKTYWRIPFITFFASAWVVYLINVYPQIPSFIIWILIGIIIISSEYFAFKRREILKKIATPPPHS